VRLSLLQGNPRQIADMVKNDQADLAIATEAIAAIDGLITLALLPVGTRAGGAARAPADPVEGDFAGRDCRISLITYDAAFAGRSKIDHAFELRS
jgi:LysR family cys regulon transcriptional activator